MAHSGSFSAERRLIVRGIYNRRIGFFGVANNASLFSMKSAEYQVYKLCEEKSKPFIFNLKWARTFVMSTGTFSIDVWWRWSIFYDTIA